MISYEDPDIVKFRRHNTLLLQTLISKTITNFQDDKAKK